MTDKPLGSVHYRVRGPAHSTIRAAPHGHAAVLGRLAEGDDWIGVPIVGQAIYVKGSGSSSVWVRSADMRFVWEGALEEVTGEGV